MFSSSNSINSQLHLSPSNFLLTSPFLPQNENDNIILPQQDHEIFLNPKKKTRRKDQHSKIYTAHGLRDRRVRLSIDIACKFFKLQDMLGFDKASKTIGWLLKNSESSINELEQKQVLNTDGFENISSISELCEGELGTSVKNTLGKSKEKKIDKQNRSSFCGLTKESRARARARARERTRERIMSTQKIDDPKPSISIRSNDLLSDIEACEGMVGDVINGSPSNPKFENPLITLKDWDKNLFAEYEVFSKYFEAFNC